MSSPASRPLYSVFSHSVGANTAGHSLLDKLRAIASAGFDGVELFQDDLDAFARSEEFQRILEGKGGAPCPSMTPPDSPPGAPKKVVHPMDLATYTRSLSSASSSSSSTAFSASSEDGRDDHLRALKDDGSLLVGSDGLPMTFNAHGTCSATDAALELAAARHVRRLCESLGLAIYSLQPLRDFEGWTCPEDRRLAFQRARSRFEVMNALGTDLLLICSNNQPAPKTTGDIGCIGRDLAELADLATAFGTVVTIHGGPQPIRVGYEALSWGAHVDLWSQAWEAVQAADRANLGLILDSFNTLGRQYADPCSPTGIVETADPYGDLMASLKDIGHVPAERIFFLQIGDARRMQKPLPPSPNDDEPRPARMIWSRGNRLFPGEEHLGAFLPVDEFMTAAVKWAGYRGPWSIEVFNSSLLDTGAEVPVQHARRARDGLDKLVESVFK
ncbi:uncharacterized protein PFL1_00203 [Pseudozyma flocculosa PF-1]|uniref:Related to dehydroshikimate dehydratase n=1 Tax=Pseudozyma flocculosa TaxID=84751 RepID=A0A5C3EVF6_9BASI|nr:uncharacterized protein PFL1_00203 [Pseudozyma flocculosa PF-1]EPQ32005.1 hypothetical protein PFL1_00203 [Pseudozyma flocculosa PF-1]SPO35071.1 related to dehydroshikimate dehydratase [Pseudozyma flocculosa]